MFCQKFNFKNNFTVIQTVTSTGNSKPNMVKSKYYLYHVAEPLSHNQDPANCLSTTFSTSIFKTFSESKRIILPFYCSLVFKKFGLYLTSRDTFTQTYIICANTTVQSFLVSYQSFLACVVLPLSSSLPSPPELVRLPQSNGSNASNTDTRELSSNPPKSIRLSPPPPLPSLVGSLFGRRTTSPLLLLLLLLLVL